MGSETLPATNRLFKKLRVTERATERVVIGVTREDRDKSEHQITNIQDSLGMTKVKK